MLTSPQFFGLTTATPLQRAACRIVDGIPLGELAHDPDVTAAVGGVSALAALPVGTRPFRVELYSGIRTAKSLITAACAVRASQSVDISHLRAGETPRIAVVSLDMDKARVVLDHLVGTILARPALKLLLAAEPSGDSVLLRHPSGRVVEIKVVAGARAGGSLVARWLLGAIFDEGPRMLSAEDGAVVNLTDGINAVEGRIVDGGQVLIVGSPYAPWGECYDSVREHWGKPSRHRVVLKAPAFVLNPVWWTPERCTDLKARNPRAYKTDVLGEFADAATQAFDSELIARALEPTGIVEAVGEPVGVLDDAGGGDDAVASAVVQMVRRRPGKRWEIDETLPDGGIVYRLRAGQRVPLPAEDSKPFAMIRGWLVFDGEPRKDLSWDAVVEKIAAHWQQLGVKRSYGDQFQSRPLTSALGRVGIHHTKLQWTQDSKIEALARARVLFRDGGLRIAGGDETAKIRDELVRLEIKPTAAGGQTIGARSRGHDDRVACVLCACMLDAAGELRGSGISIDRRIIVTAGPYG
jgi:hypothetical protein